MSKKLSDSGLTARQEAFCQEYIVDLNGTAAARRAGYSAHTANEKAAQLMAIPLVQARVAELMAERSKRVEITADDVLRELGKIAFGKMSDVATWTHSDVSFTPSSDISQDADAAIAEVSVTETQHGGSRKIKRHDKVKALELIGRHLGMFKEQSAPVLNVSGDVTVVQKDLEERLRQVKGEEE